jgi:hypothetical protein
MCVESSHYRKYQQTLHPVYQYNYEPKWEYMVDVRMEKVYPVNEKVYLGEL